MKTSQLLIPLLTLLCAVAFAQTSKKKVAVYMGGGEPIKGSHEVLGTELAKALSNSGIYTAVDRSEDARKIVAQEQIFQRSGVVNKENIKKLGKQLEVDVVCVAKVTEVMKSHYLTATLVDVESAEIIKVGSEAGDMTKGSDIVRTARTVAQELVSGQNPSYETPSASADRRPPLKSSYETPAKSGVFTDSRDGKNYKTVKIGNQVWMAENLNYAAGGSRCYYNDNAYCKMYGRLYNWSTANNVCPSGWHLPSKGEWDLLDRDVGGSNMAGRKLKSKSGWDDNGNGTDEYGFSALPGGFGSSAGFGFDDMFMFSGKYGGWWSSSSDYNGAYLRAMNGDTENTGWGSNGSSLQLLSVRCVQN